VNELPSLVGLRDAGGLRQLELRNCAALTSLDGVAAATQLQQLDVLNCLALTSVCVPEGGRLREASFCGCDALTGVAGAAGGLGGVTRLDFAMCRALVSLDGLAGATALAELNLLNCRALTSLQGLAPGVEEGLKLLRIDGCTALVQ